MRNAIVKTPSGKQQERDLGICEKTSGKKMVQARLPFKIITPEVTSTSGIGSSASLVESTESTTVTQDSRTAEEVSIQESRKRRLSFDGQCKSNAFSFPESKENAIAALKKKKCETTMEADIVMLDDSDDDSLKANGVVQLCHNYDLASATLQSNNNAKGAGTPKTTHSKGNKVKLQIKLPRCNKIKRKKRQDTSVVEDKKEGLDITRESSDDIEVIPDEFNPQKRQRMDDDEKDKNTFVTEKYSTKKLDVLKANEKVVKSTCRESDIINLNTDTEDSNGASISTNFFKVLPKDADVRNKASGENKCDRQFKKMDPEDLSNVFPRSMLNVEAIDEAGDDDEDVVESSVSSVIEEVVCKPCDKSLDDNLERRLPKTAEHDNMNRIHLAEKSPDAITPKQQRLKEQRRLAREAKELKLQEEKLQKQREKEEKELARKLEREGREEQKRREREEKEETKRKEREGKERKRLADIQAKNEEKRKRIEVKEEELRKKEEDRKRKENEKEEAENKKKKAAEAFTKFFVPKTTRLSVAVEALEPSAISSSNVVSGGQCMSLAFRPFQIKGDMELAPVCRKVLTDVARENLDSYICKEKQNSSQIMMQISQLYLSELRAGTVVPGKWRRSSSDNKGEDNDVILIEDELECAAQSIDEEGNRPMQRFRAKFYKFHENRRPPYFGTWRKKTSVVTPRRPFALDKILFDYEVDSDLEWEEEEPGESLDGSDEEEKEKESEDEDYEVDNEWFVPHGHLSDEELQNEDEGVDNTTREAQKAKLKIIQQEFAQEMKKKTEKIKPRLIGCIWQDHQGKQPELCPNIIWESLNVRSMIYTTAPLVEEPAVEPTNEGLDTNTVNPNNTGAATAEKLRRIVLTETMLKDLIRLVHGNRHSKAFLINEFIAYIERTEDDIKNGELRGPLKSVVRDRIDELAQWQVVESTNSVKSKKNKKKLCWLVSQEKLKEYDLEDLELYNKWCYILQPKFVDTHGPNIKQPSMSEEDITGVTLSVISKERTCFATQTAISNFTKIITEEKEEPLQRNANDSSLDATLVTGVKNSSAHNNSTSSPTPITIVKKRVPLLISTPRGQHISTDAKNTLISQYLKKNKCAVENTDREEAPLDDGQAIVID